MMSELLEDLAELEHEQWEEWTGYLQQRMTDWYESCAIVEIDKVVWDRWMRQKDTPYAGLSEKSKEFHRGGARKALAKTLTYLGPAMVTGGKKYGGKVRVEFFVDKDEWDRVAAIARMVNEEGE